jgi:hypothetical protein
MAIFIVIADFIGNFRTRLTLGSGDKFGKAFKVVRVCAPSTERRICKPSLSGQLNNLFSVHFFHPLALATSAHAHS